MAEETKIQEAEVESADFSDEQSGEKKVKKISSEIIMILIIGFLFGIAIKTEVAKRINVVDSTFYAKQGYDFVEIQKRLDEQVKARSQEQNQAPAEVSPSQVPDQTPPAQ